MGSCLLILLLSTILRFIQVLTQSHEKIKLEHSAHVHTRFVHMEKDVEMGVILFPFTPNPYIDVPAHHIRLHKAALTIAQKASSLLFLEYFSVCKLLLSSYYD